MKKNILKEIIIILLLTLAIILILGVLLYGYIPSNKIVPEKVSYATPENVAEEIQSDSNVDDSQVVVTYQIDATDLKNYKKIQEYVPGRKNPFASVEQTNEVDEETAKNDSSSTNSNKANVNTDKSSTTSAGSTSSTTGYLPDKGTK